MFELFRQKPRRQEILFNVSGEEHGIEVSLRNYPVGFTEEEPERRVECYPDFNGRMIDAIWKEIGRFECFASRALKGTVSLNVKVKGAPEFICDIRLLKDKSERQFMAEFPDAIIAAFKNSGIGR
jgi:hypothetical protein